MRTRSYWHLGSWCVASCTLLLLASLSCASQHGTEAKGDAYSARREGPPPSVRALVRSMSDFLASQRSFSLHAETSFEEFDKGQKLQFAGTADLQVRRPNGLHVDYRDDLSAKRLWYDGVRLTLLDLLGRVYAVTGAPPELDDALDHFESKYDLRMPLADLIGPDAYSQIASAARSASYVGLHDVGGRACHHIAFVGDQVDFQLWIRADPQPEPCKLVIDYKDGPGRPQYVSVMRDWEFGQKLPDSIFVAKIPESARKIEFLEIEEARR